MVFEKAAKHGTEGYPRLDSPIRLNSAAVGHPALHCHGGWILCFNLPDQSLQDWQNIYRKHIPDTLSYLGAAQVSHITPISQHSLILCLVESKVMVGRGLYNYNWFHLLQIMMIYNSYSTLLAWSARECTKLHIILWVMEPIQSPSQQMFCLTPKSYALMPHQSFLVVKDQTRPTE